MSEATRRQTRGIRVFADFGEKVSWVAQMEGITHAELLEELCGEAVDARYARIKDRVEIIKAALVGPADADPAFANELGGEG